MQDMPVELMYVRAAYKDPKIKAELCIKECNKPLQVLPLDDLKIKNLAKDLEAHR